MIGLVIGLAVAQGLAQEPAEIVCNELEAGPPAGARAVAASALPWVNDVRARFAAGDTIQPEPERVEAWLDVDLPYTERFQARAQAVGDELIVELRAPIRPAVVPANVVAVVDVSNSMSSVPTRAFPLLHDAPSSHRYRPVSRLELAREALWDLIEHLPEGSRLSILAYDGRRARVVLPPTDDPVRMGLDVSQLTEGVIAATDDRVPVALDRISTDTFLPCEDNRVFVFTDDAQDLSNEMLFESVERWSVGDLERWTLAIGDLDPIDAEKSLLQQPPRTARWVLNSASDARTLWPLLLHAGGVSAKNVVVHGRRDAVELGDLVSGQGVAVRMPLRRARQVSLTVDGVEVEVPRLEPGPTSSARGGGGAASGQGTELAAWGRPEPAEASKLLAVSGWVEQDAVVVELWQDPEHPVDPGALSIRGPDGVAVAPTAWGNERDRLLVVAPIQGAPNEVTVSGQGLPEGSWVPLRRRRVGRAWVEGAQALREGRSWEPPTTVKDPRLASLLAGVSAAKGDDEGVLRWTNSCLDLIAPDLLESCVVRRAEVLLRQDRLAEVLPLLDAALERVPRSVELALLDADIASDHQEWTVAEERYLQALEAAPFDARASRGLALVMQEQNLPSLAALAWTRHLLFHPDDRRGRESLLALLTAESWRLGPQRGPLSEVDKLATSKRLYQMKLLFEDWSQATRKGNTLEDWEDDPWYRLVGSMFSKLDRDGYVRFAAIRVLVHPDELAEHVSEGVGEVGLMLGMRR